MAGGRRCTGLLGLDHNGYYDFLAGVLKLFHEASREVRSYFIRLKHQCSGADVTAFSRN